ncbi:arginine decarboxylase [Xanthomonas fragariae]|uniref:Biosynthetic arginine decarboxylase n=2 Tax=Xanthomonas fragariae TaxID=48664 RepID=A0A1Y6HBK8_9XANT|nr:arginine decarboxylase [Xanthomonas fragariae]AOD13664.1 arginine decarboxylase [Xanthomonas fragariae]AOD17052.1 arginine decarboxylase [Xanthomonas fragariae]ENZ95106.1 arginine decarboxylase [Xanthomonas fragariae LMG 25863]MBL9198006.1 arginine decarboxylase [Xanthomonas fragariae]MBL9222520.1 arginine decarboxylase [Xanthomonas fragariae]
MSDWSLDQARKTYSIPHWADGYFDVNDAGHVVVTPTSDGPSVSLPEVVDAARAAGAKLPLLVRFPDILGQRLGKLQAAFAQAQSEWDYAGGYTAVYPIKVNQHRGVAGTLASHHGDGFGLEAGSKPELMAVLALSRPGGLIVCNGYKDREYIRLALIGRKLGLQTFIVIEKPSELKLVLEEARALDLKPGLGVRMRLASLGAGKWQNSGGDKAKFGLSPRQVLDLWKTLRDTEYADSLQLLHFHMGSQISNVRDIANGMREATRYFVELSRLGAKISHVDVGGGLGIDYEGTRSRSYCSINYGLHSYASNIVQPLASACEEHGLVPPRIVTECGRAMTAHHAVLIANVSEVEQAPEGRVPDAHDDEPTAIRHLRAIHDELDVRPAVELFQEAQHFHAEGVSAYALGQIDLIHRARIDDLFYAIAHGVRARLSFDEKSHRQVLDELNERLVDKYFVNFSVFESIPDVWAIDQVFPILPIERLNEAPQRRGIIADMTCDSDGMVKTYVENESLDSSLPLHTLNAGESYRIGFFLVGAYQEILGDIHNLFGDTDAVEVTVDGDGYRIAQQRRGDTTDVMLDYVGYQLDTLRATYAERIAAAQLSPERAQQLSDALEAGLTGYTYLSDEPLG